MAKKTPPNVELDASGAVVGVQCGGRHAGDKKLYPTSAHWFECRTCEGNVPVKQVASMQAKHAAKKIYILNVRMTKNEPHIWDPRFAFHAKDDVEAKTLADGWARYQGMTSSEVGLQQVAKESDLPYTQDFIHDDWARMGT